MLMNEKGAVFSVCEKAMSQPFNINLERIRDIHKAIIDKILDTCPMDLKKRGHELPSGNIHGLVKTETGTTMIYVCPVIDSYEPTDGQLIHALTMAQEIPSSGNVNAIMLLVVNLSTGEVEQVNSDFEPPYKLLTEPLSIGNHCRLCNHWGECHG